MRTLIAAGFVIAATTAAARADERSTTISLGGVIGVHGLDGYSRRAPGDGPGLAPSIGHAERFGGPRLTLAWERPSLPYPAQPGYNVGGQLVPELIAGAFLDDRVAEGMLGVGLRGELRVSQREQGLFRISARAVFYLAARALVIGEHRDPSGELVLGEYILVGRSFRFGIEGGATARRRDTMTHADTGLVGQLFLGWSM